MNNQKTQLEIKNQKTTTQKLDKKRFTFLIEFNLLSQIKLISFLTNQTLSNTINESIILFIKDFELKNNTQINDIMDFNKLKK
jgi:hypothetical protein|tara:strand:- start:429 stop:677 length:249 start_codon:yes stop_codon:yes gene_type:complete